MTDAVVVCAEVELCLPSSYSLKDKRQILRSALDRLHRRFSLAAAEVAGQEQWNRAVLAIAAVGGEEGPARKAVEHALLFLEEDGRCEITAKTVSVF